MKKVINKFTWILFIAVLPLNMLKAQQNNSDNESNTLKGFDIFVSAGMYVGHRENANYYRGIHIPSKSNYGDPNIRNIFNNRYRISEIKDVLDADPTTLSDSVSLGGLSEMTYRVSFAFNVGLRYRLGKYVTLGITFGQALLTAQGTATIDLLNTSGINIGDINHKQYPLIGKERRNFFGLNLLCYIPTKSIITPFVEAGIHINSVKIRSADLFVEKRPFTLINWYGEGMEYVPNTEYTTVDPKLGGVGFGLGMGIGIKIAFTPWFSIDPIAEICAEKPHLAGYDKMTPNFNFAIRLVMSDKIFALRKD
jgi:hypothetical protein